jgi:hypothetical protein
MNLLGALALVSVLSPEAAGRGAAGLVALLAVLTPAVAIVRIIRAVAQGLPEREFAQWFPEIERRD